MNVHKVSENLIVRIVLKNKYFYNGCFTYFDRLNFQGQNEKKQTSVTVTEVNTVNTAVFT